MIEPFQLHVGDDVLDDLRERLARTRLPDEADDAGWDYGTNRAFLSELVAYWRDGFDWRAAEARLNEYPQFRTVVGGDPIHFVHITGSRSGRPALVLTHGWPSTFTELLPLVPLLRDDFDLVIPALPGFGFSTPLTRRGRGASTTGGRS